MPSHSLERGGQAVHGHTTLLGHGRSRQAGAQLKRLEISMRPNVADLNTLAWGPALARAHKSVRPSSRTLAVTQEPKTSANQGEVRMGVDRQLAQTVSSASSVGEILGTGINEQDS